MSLLRCFLTRRNTFENPQNFYDVFVLKKKFFLMVFSFAMLQKKFNSLCKIIFSALTVSSPGWFVPSFFNRFMRLHNIFLWRRFIALLYEEEAKTERITIIIHPLRCRFPPKNERPKEVHRRSQIIWNIYVSQINSRWNESAEDICTILKCSFLRGRIMHRSLFLRYFSVRQSSN